MRKLIVSEWVTLDGVFDADSMQQWNAPFDSEERQNPIRDGILASDGMLIGRTTYEMFAGYWPRMKNNEMGVAAKLNSMPKYVVSSKLKSADWNNSTIIKGDVAAEISKLKQQSGRQILVNGSATLIQSLMKTDLVDEYQFLVHPIIMGSGKRFFKDGMQMTKLKLINSKRLSKGVHLLSYQPA